MWYNPATGAVERNEFSSGGWSTININGALNATSGITPLFSGMIQPNVQSHGVLHPTTNFVLFYDSGNLHLYNRTTATLVVTIPLTGIPLTNVMPFNILYTGRQGYEVGLYDYVARRVLLFNKATGAYTGFSQMPTSAVALASTMQRIGYTNHRFWIFNAALKKWNAYCIWNVACDIYLPVELLEFKATCAEGRASLFWATGSESNASHFVIERSLDGEAWKEAGTVAAVGNSQQRVDYRWLDHEPVNILTYYRLRQVDTDGTEEVLPMAMLHPCDARQAVRIPESDQRRVDLDHVV